MKNLRVIILVLILAVLAVGYYYYLSNKTNEDSLNAEDTEVSEVFKALNRDLENDYPTTPREVILFYVEVQQCFYNEEYSQEEFVGLVSQARVLMDDELITLNPYNQHFEDLSVDIKEKEATGTTLSSYIISKNSEVDYITFEEQEYSNVRCIYYFKNDEGTVGSDQEYILRKDPEGKWKILASNIVIENGE